MKDASLEIRKMAIKNLAKISTKMKGNLLYDQISSLSED